MPSVDEGLTDKDELRKYPHCRIAYTGTLSCPTVTYKKARNNKTSKQTKNKKQAKRNR